MSVRFAEGGRERILEQALALSGVDRDGRTENALDTLASLAAAWCGRGDIPRQMEGAMAVLLSRSLQGEDGRQVSSVKRGDTTITYAGGQPGFSAQGAELLAPFVRLSSPEGRWNP